jgi:hypothetical protein
MEDALLCGAYEAVALAVPMILSDTPVLKEYFNKGAVYTLNNSKSIAKAVIKAKNEYPKLKDDVYKLKNELNMKWFDYYEKLNISLNSI